MRTSFYKILLIIAIFVLVVACQESFTPDDLDDDKKIPVIEGIITNRPGPYIIRLKWATAYNKTTEIPIEKAFVRITDDKGNEELLTEVEAGKYKTAQGGIIGTIGNTYTLTVDLPDGSQYVSSPGILRSIPEIKNIYTEAGSDEAIRTTSTGDIVIREYRGLNVYVDLNPDQQSYYRYTANYFTQKKYIGTIGTDQPESIVIFCIDHEILIDLPNIKATLYNDGKYEIRQHKLGFLPYFEYDFELQDDTLALPYILGYSGLSGISAPYFSGWVSKIAIFSINEDVYSYYESVSDQLSTTINIFDPIPTQIKSNFTCTTDSSKFALGIFEVASVNTYQAAFFWDGYGTTGITKPLDNYTWIACDTCVDGGYPEFWINP